MREEDRQACAELVLVPGSEFATVHGFVPAASRDALLAIEAVFRSLRDIPLTVSDPSVGIAKIAWWQQELRQAKEQGTQHPVVRAVVDCGGLSLLDPDGFNDYLHALVEELQEDPVPNVGALADRFGRVSGQEALLFAGVTGGPAAPLRSAGSAARMLELLRTLARRETEHRWLPMDLVARHQYRPGDEDPATRDALVADLATEALAWRDAVPLEASACRSAGAGFVALRDQLVQRRLETARAAPARWLETRQRASFGEVFSTWRLARKLGRPV